MATYTTRYVKVAQNRGQAAPWFRRMQIWLKLALSLGALAALTLVVVIVANLASAGVGQRLASADELHLPAALAAASAQSDLARMVGDLQAYVVTGRPGYRDGYAGSAAALAQDMAALDGLAGNFAAADRQRLAELKAAVTRWTALQDRLLASRDPGVFETEAGPLAGQMSGLLDQMAAAQRSAAQSALGQGRLDLNRASWATLGVGLAAVLLALAMFLFLLNTIDGPIHRLTGTAERVRAGDLGAQVVVEAQDEIGRLAETFNRMTRNMRRTLFQTRRERQRADDLLNVVIPLGLQLSGEKEFERLLENIVVQAQTFCHAACGVLYLRNKEGHLQPIVVRDEPAGLALGGTTGQAIPYEAIPLDDPMYSLTVRAAWFGATVSVPDAVPAGGVNYVSPAFVDNPYDNNTSFLAIPLRGSQAQVMGVLQLTGARDPDTQEVIPFDSHLQQMMDSFSLLAAAALEGYQREQGLKDQIFNLKIEIDEVRRQQQVKDIVESDFFPSLQAKARQARERNARGGDSEETKPSETEST